MVQQSNPRLKEAIRLTGLKMPLREMPRAIKLIVWDLMKNITRVNKMDEQIRKIEKKVKGTEKSLKSLEKMDKKRDKIVAVARKMKAKRGR